MNTMTALAYGGLIACALGALTGCASLPGEVTPPDLSLSGTWMLDRDRSDSLRPDNMAARRGAGGTRGPGMGGRPGGGGVPGGGRPAGGGRPEGMGGGRSGGPDAATVRMALAGMFVGQDSLGFTVDSTTVIVRSPRGASVTLVTDGENRVLELAPGVDARVRAGWRDGGLVIEHELEGIEVREVFSIAPGSRTLVAEAYISGVGPSDRTVTTVYGLKEP